MRRGVWRKNSGTACGTISSEGDQRHTRVAVKRLNIWTSLRLIKHAPWERKFMQKVPNTWMCASVAHVEGSALHLHPAQRRWRVLNYTRPYQDASDRSYTRFSPSRSEEAMASRETSQTDLATTTMRQPEPGGHHPACRMQEKFKSDRREN